jgi:ribonucleoside-diphosphate reductase beta chain
VHVGLFTDPWLRRWQGELNASDAYRHAARHWEWPVVLVVRPDAAAGFPDEVSVYLDLYHGACRAIRVAHPGDRDEVKYVIEGEAETWRQILHRQLDPVMALMQRKLHLEKGGLLALSRHMKAARELVLAAARATAVEKEIAPPATSASAARRAGRPRHETPAPEGLRGDTLPMRLYHKAKRLGTWDPQDLDFTRDRDDWSRLSALEREVLLHLTALFQAGEESVTDEILPLILAVARDGHLDEQLYLATFLFEEAKHTEFFYRFLDEVAETREGLTRFHGASYRAVFYDALPAAMRRLLDDTSPAAQVEAAVTYNMIVEGTLAETGYHAYHAMLEREGLLPGLREGLGLLRRDESRHIAYGLHLLSRHVVEDPALWEVLRRRMETLLEPALGVIHELFDAYDAMPFGLRIEDFVDHAMRQFEARMVHLEAARAGRAQGSADAE